MQDISILCLSATEVHYTSAPQMAGCFKVVLMDDQTDHRSHCSKRHPVAVCSSPGPRHYILIDCMARDVEMVPGSNSHFGIAYIRSDTTGNWLSENSGDNADDG